MNCEKNKFKLHQLLDGELSLIEQKEIKKHLKNCHICTQEYKFLQFTLSAIKNIPYLSLSDGFNKNVLTALGLKMKPAISAKPFFWIFLSALAIIMSCIFVLEIFLISIYGLEKAKLVLKIIADPYNAILNVVIYLTKTFVLIKQSMQVLSALTGVFLSTISTKVITMFILGLIVITLLSIFISKNHKYITAKHI